MFVSKKLLFKITDYRYYYLIIICIIVIVKKQQVPKMTTCLIERE